MYLRYTQPPGDLYDWYEDYLQDEEEIDVKAGGGQVSQLYEPPITRTQQHPSSDCRSLTELFAGPNHRPDGVPVYDQAGLVLHSLSAHTRAHPEADREED